MADFTYDGADSAPATRGVATAANWAGALVSLALIAGVGVWGYRLLVRDVSGIPVVQAVQGPMREAPNDPGGQLADHQGLAVNAVAGRGGAEDAADRLVLAPAPPGLSSEDVALGAIKPAARPEAQPKRVTLTPMPSLAEPAPEAPVMAEETGAAEPDGTGDAIQRLVEQIAAGAVPLTDMEPGEAAAVVTEISETDSADEAEVVTEVQAPLPVAKPGEGLVRSLRPMRRPVGLQTASLEAAVTPTEAEAQKEIDPAAIPTGTRLVQIGAFDSAETARSEWARLEARFGDYLVDKSRVIQRASSGGRVFYRLRAHGFEDLADARRFCSAFVAQNVDCIPVVAR
ncbi:SPOR domain-containing protein [Thalassococcus sp. CAU 1522]|uniref:SPOR domain-containing protein n=1 Tax=Thalassococcus arenae TaxID=2851652 RepID=A0ABS6N9Q9_9RHOB|nr:SPOR domain-containing protein [Thalassococcus arenae]MBV2360749.1 SPOR domain-containing protein [Thalassococcus arenae]